MKDHEAPERIQRVLPRVLSFLPTARPKVRAKIVELLSYINRRLKVLPNLKLPLADLLLLFTQHAQHATTACT